MDGPTGYYAQLNKSERQRQTQCDVTYMWKQTKQVNRGVPIMTQWLMNPTRSHEVAGLIPALAQWVNNPQDMAKKKDKKQKKPSEQT